MNRTTRTIASKSCTVGNKVVLEFDDKQAVQKNPTITTTTTAIAPPKMNRLFSKPKENEREHKLFTLYGNNKNKEISTIAATTVIPPPQAEPKQTIEEIVRNRRGNDIFREKKSPRGGIKTERIERDTSNVGAKRPLTYRETKERGVHDNQEEKQQQQQLVPSPSIPSSRSPLDHHQIRTKRQDSNNSSCSVASSASSSGTSSGPPTSKAITTKKTTRRIVAVRPKLVETSTNAVRSRRLGKEETQWIEKKKLYDHRIHLLEKECGVFIQNLSTLFQASHTNTSNIFTVHSQSNSNNSNNSSGSNNSNNNNNYNTSSNTSYTNQLIQSIQKQMEDMEISKLDEKNELFTQIDSLKQHGHTLCEKIHALLKNYKNDPTCFVSLQKEMDVFETSLMKFKEKEKKKYQELFMEEKILEKEILFFQDQIMDQWHRNQNQSDDEEKFLNARTGTVRKHNKPETKDSEKKEQQDGEEEQEEMMKRIRRINHLMSRTGGMTGGWDEREHQVFMSCLKKYKLHDAVLLKQYFNPFKHTMTRSRTKSRRRRRNKIHEKEEEEEEEEEDSDDKEEEEEEEEEKKEDSDEDDTKSNSSDLIHRFLAKYSLFKDEFLDSEENPQEEQQDQEFETLVSKFIPKCTQKVITRGPKAVRKHFEWYICLLRLLFEKKQVIQLWKEEKEKKRQIFIDKSILLLTETTESCSLPQLHHQNVSSQQDELLLIQQKQQQKQQQKEEKEEKEKQKQQKELLRRQRQQKELLEWKKKKEQKIFLLQQAKNLEAKKQKELNTVQRLKQLETKQTVFLYKLQKAQEQNEVKELFLLNQKTLHHQHQYHQPQHPEEEQQTSSSSSPSFSSPSTKTFQERSRAAIEFAKEKRLKIQEKQIQKQKAMELPERPSYESNNNVNRNTTGNVSNLLEKATIASKARKVSKEKIIEKDRQRANISAHSAYIPGGDAAAVYVKTKNFGHMPIAPRATPAWRRNI